MKEMISSEKFEYTAQVLDYLLFCRFLVGRLGEKPRFKWWGRDLDSTDREGGGSFFQDLFPQNPEYAQISAAEMTILAAQNLERERLIEANNHAIEFSIFLAPPDLETELLDRIFQWKKNPQNIPGAILEILSPTISSEALIKKFKDSIRSTPEPKSEESTIGLWLIGDSKIKPIHRMESLLKVLPLQEGDWVFPYYE